VRTYPKKTPGFFFGYVPGCLNPEYYWSIGVIEKKFRARCERSDEIACSLSSLHSDALNVSIVDIIN